MVCFLYSHTCSFPSHYIKLFKDFTFLIKNRKRFQNFFNDTILIIYVITFFVALLPIIYYCVCVCVCIVPRVLMSHCLICGFLIFFICTIVHINIDNNFIN